MSRHRQLDLLAHRVDRLADNVRETFNQLAEQTANVAAIAARHYDTSRTGGRHITVQYEPDPDEIHYDDTGKRTTPEHPTDRIPVTNVEATMLELDRIDGYRTTLIDAIATLEVCVKMAESANRDARTYRAPTPPPALCRDGVHGKDMTPELYGEIINCHDPADKGGHCSRHYYRLYRERRDAGRNVANMHEPGRT